MSHIAASLVNPYTVEWIDWIGENLALNVPEETMINAMVEEGISREIATCMIVTSKLLVSRDETPQKSNVETKMKWILECSAEMDKVQTAPIDIRSEIGNTEFYERYYFRNTPLLISNWVESKKLKEVLTWNRLREKYGETQVEVQTNRSADRHYERNSNLHRETLGFSTFLDRVCAEESNEIYLTANNGRVNRDVFSSITDSNEWMPEILDPENSKGKAFLWIGPKGTVTQLHHDLTNNLLLQAVGAKEIYLFPPSAFSRCYNSYHCYSDFDCENPDFERFPAMENINIRRVTLHEGQAIFLPVGWWHQVRSLSPSISITAVNFRHWNDFASTYTTYEAIY